VALDSEQYASRRTCTLVHAGRENDGLEFDGQEQRAVMSLLQERMHTLKTVTISICRRTFFETVIFLP